PVRPRLVGSRPGRRPRRLKGLVPSDDRPRGQHAMIDFRNVSTEEFASVGATYMAEHISAAISDRGQCHLALSGGRAPWELFGVLARQPVDWANVHVWQVDERVLPDRDVDR